MEILIIIGILVLYLFYKNSIKCSCCKNLNPSRYCSVQEAYISEPSESNCWSSVKR